MKRLPSYVARKSDPGFDKIGFEEVIVGLLENNGPLTIDHITRRLKKDGVRRKRPFTRKSLIKVLLDLEDMGFIYSLGGRWYVS
jgi:hypothetical protein